MGLITISTFTLFWDHCFQMKLFPHVVESLIQLLSYSRKFVRISSGLLHRRDEDMLSSLIMLFLILWYNRPGVLRGIYVSMYVWARVFNSISCTAGIFFFFSSITYYRLLGWWKHIPQGSWYSSRWLSIDFNKWVPLFFLSKIQKQNKTKKKREG